MSSYLGNAILRYVGHSFFGLMPFSFEEGFDA